MNTFREYIEWVEGHQKRLDQIWEESVREWHEVTGGNVDTKYLDVIPYSERRDDFLGERSIISPYQDNNRIVLGIDRSEAIDLIKRAGWKEMVDLRKEEGGVNRVSVDGREVVSTFDYRFEEDLAEIELYSQEGNLIIYTGVDGLARHFAGNESESPKDRESSYEIQAKSEAAIYPRQHMAERIYFRAREKNTADRLIVLMKDIVDRDIPAILQNKCSSGYCVVNA